jgi:Zn finger protein HypA/HybF involved in hydrogenase expression
MWCPVCSTFMILVQYDTLRCPACGKEMSV